jgi:SNF2 family DNA or RNA helicase
MLKTHRPADFTAKHRGFVYQVEALEAVKDLPFSAVFHEQGLGKTKIGVDLALYWLTHDIVDSVIIVTKKGLLRNWKDELAVHTHLEPRLLSQDKRANFFAFNSPARIYLAHYEVLKSEQKRLALFLRTRRVGILLDEAHKIKNPDSSIAKVLFSLRTGFTRRLIMTGTPVANRPYDLWSQIRFLDGGVALGPDFKDFKRDLDLTNELVSDPYRVDRFQRALAGVFAKIAPFTVRETKDTVEISLPEKELRNIEVELESRQSEIYKRFQKDLSAIVVKGGKAVLDDAEEMLKRLMRLVQVASNPALVDDSYRAIPGKFEILLNLIHAAVDVGEKMIVWTSFTDNVDWLARELTDFGAVRVHGKRSIFERDLAIKRFKTDSTCKILIATPAAAKEGLTLTIANHAVFYDRSFSLDDYLQAQDRIHRISQTRSCYVTNLIGSNTIDEWVDVLLAAKHLAAQLGQGDITLDEYSKQATYTYGAMIRDVLGLDGNHADA